MSQVKVANGLSSVLSAWTASFLSRFPRRRAGWLKGSIQGYEYCCKVYNKPSESGINGGRISKLEIRKDDVTLASYDRGWDVEPVSQDAKDIVTILCMSMSQQ